MCAQWGCGWYVWIVATVVWESGHVSGRPAQLSAHELKRATISSCAQIGWLRSRNFVRSWMWDSVTTLDYRKFMLCGSHRCSYRNIKTTECKSVRTYWIVQPHPPYSPDLASADFHLFVPMNDGLHSNILLAMTPSSQLWKSRSPPLV
jgi:hypothetical protein